MMNSRFHLYIWCILVTECNCSVINVSKEEKDVDDLINQALRPTLKNSEDWQQHLNGSLVFQHFHTTRSKGNYIRSLGLNQNVIDCYSSQTDVDRIKCECEPIVNDPFYLRQWFMLPWRSTEGQEHPFDHGVLPVWFKYQNFGQQVKVMVIDSGIEITHEDLRDNYSPEYGYNTFTEMNDPRPTSRNFNIAVHGTQCAGIIAMAANNRKCGVGVAPLVTLGAVRTNDHFPMSCQIKAISFKHREVDVTNNSYFIPLNNLYFEHRWIQHYFDTIRESISNGRNGKGVIHVFPACNDRIYGRMCGTNILINSMYTIGVATCTAEGKLSSYSERCPAIMVTVFSSQGQNDPQFGIPTTSLNNQCNGVFGYTSAGTPIAAGIIALALKANSQLTWRDVQHLVTTSTRLSRPMLRTGEWHRNAGGFYVSPDFGFGFLDAFNLVTKARTFTLVPPLHGCIIPIAEYGRPTSSRLATYLRTLLGPASNVRYEFGPNEGMFLGRNNWLQIQIKINGCAGTSHEINFIEHVQLRLSFNYVNLGDVQIYLQSPAGTGAKFLDPQPLVKGPPILRYWTFDSIMTWGESPRGKWTIDFYDLTGPPTNYGGINYMALVVHGTKDKPGHYGAPGQYRSWDSYAAKDFLEAMNTR